VLAPASTGAQTKGALCCIPDASFHVKLMVVVLAAQAAFTRVLGSRTTSPSLTTSNTFASSWLGPM
jgi:hypothetical protein